MNGVSQEQMLVLQQKAQDMILQLKEEEKWNLYCNKKSVPITEGHNPKIVKFQPGNANVSNLDQGSSESVFTQGNHSSKETTVGIPGTQSATGENKIVSRELRFIKAQLINLQTGLAELKSGKFPQRNAWESYYEELLKNNKHNQSINRIVLLRKNLENSLTRINLGRKPAASHFDPQMNETARPKAIGFQIPYVLKEQRAVAQRSNNRSWSSITAKKNVTKNTSRPCFQPRILPKHLDIASNKERTSKKQTNFRSNALPLFRNRNIAQDGTVDKMAREIIEDSFDEAFSAIQKVQKQKEKHVNEDILSLVKQIEEIKKIQNDICEKCQIQPPHQLGETDADPINQNNKAKNGSCESPKMFDSSGRGLYPTDDLKLKNDREDKEMTTLCLETNALKRIHEYKKSFHSFVNEQYGGIDQKIIDRVAEMFYDECLDNIATELNSIPHSVVLDLYNKEFIT